MRTLTRRTRRSRSAKGATFIEFTMVLPIFLFMMLFTIDMGSIMLMSGAMNDNVFSAARAGAQIGGAGVVPGTVGTAPCQNDQFCPSSTAGKAFSDGLSQIPFSSSLYDSTDLKIDSGAVCLQDGNDSYVKVQADYTVHLITPGLGAMLSMINGGANDHPELRNGYALTAVGVARCEVFRQKG